MSKRYYYDYTFSSQKNSIVKLVDEVNELVITGFMDSPNYNIQIDHSFDSAGSSGIIGTMRGIYESIRPVAARHAAMIDQVASGITSFLSDKGAISPELESTVNGVKNYILGNARNLISNNLEIADDYLFLFKGTSIGLPTTFKTYLISDDGVTDIYDTLRIWYDRLIGDFDVEGNTSLIGIQKPPNNYQATLYGLKTTIDPNDDDGLKGTFKLHIGDESKAGFSVEGLVVNSLSLDVSRTVVKLDSGAYRPLMIEATFTLKYIKKLSKNDLLINLRG